jgi:hypothetical protein
VHLADLADNTTAADDLNPSEQRDPVEEYWRTLVELVVEAMLQCLTDGTRIPGRGLGGVEDTLNQALGCGKNNA